MANDELSKRILTATVILPVFLFCLITDEAVWTFLLIILAMLMIVEWNNLSRHISFSIHLLGFPYIAFAITSAILLRSYENGIEYLLFVVSCVAATDTFAYFGGKRFGRHKLAPDISPNKTWEGLICGAIASAIIGVMFSGLDGYPHSWLDGFVIGVAIAFISQAGDLLESWIKRQAGVKDSGTLLPGHGGILDRMDGYLPALPIFYAFVSLDMVI